MAAGGKKHWKTVRLAAAILGKVVDTLAPAITSVLVRGKEVLLLISQKSTPVRTYISSFIYSSQIV